MFAAAALLVLTPSIPVQEKWDFFWRFLIMLISLCPHSLILKIMIKSGFDGGRMGRDWITKAMMQSDFFS